MKRTLNPFVPTTGKPRQSLGGARPGVQRAAYAMESSNAPMLVARMYAPPSIAHYDDSDPRFQGYSEQVENLYLLPNDPPKRRSGVEQVFNWLLNGELK